MATMTPELRRAIAEGGGQPTRLDDPETNISYVLIRADEFEKLQALLTEEGHVRDHYPSIDRIFGNEWWNDPAMDLYDDYDANKS